MVLTAGEMLLVRFMHLDSRDPDRECTLFVDLSQDDYKGEKLRLELEQKIDLDLDLLHHAALWIPTEPGALRVAAGWLSLAATLGRWFLSGGAY